MYIVGAYYDKNMNIHISPKLYLVNLQRGQIKRCFNNSNLTKSKHSIEYLDCTIQELIDMFNTKIKYFMHSSSLFGASLDTTKKLDMHYLLVLTSNTVFSLEKSTLS